MLVQLASEDVVGLRHAQRVNHASEITLVMEMRRRAMGDVVLVGVVMRLMSLGGLV